MLCCAFDTFQNKVFESQLRASCFSILKQLVPSNYQITAVQFPVPISINFVNSDLFHSALMLQTHHTLLSLSSCRMRTCLKISLHGLLSLLNDHSSFISSTVFYFIADPHTLGVVTSLNISPINLSF